MSAKDEETGGPAFPVPHAIDGNWVKDPRPEYSGMTLRDYFAAKAAAGLCSNEWHGRFMLGKCNSGDPGAAYQQVATTAYRIADAMISARKEPQP